MQSKLAAAIALATFCYLWGQSAPAPLSFDVASVKPAAPDARGTSIQLQPRAGLRVTNAPLRFLVTYAYDIRDFQLSGGPGWMATEHYDIMAKSEPVAGTADVPEDPRKMSDQQLKTVDQQMRERMRSLLAERFQLVIHHESREAPIYVLLVAKGGPKLEEAQPATTGPRGMRMFPGYLTGMSAPLQMLTTTLSAQLGRPVLDKTDLKGNYNFKLQWTPDAPADRPLPLPPVPPGVELPPPPDPNGPTLFTAIQEQLGLRLESQKGPIDMIVIDRIEKASEN